MLETIENYTQPQAGITVLGECAAISRNAEHYAVSGHPLYALELLRHAINLASVVSNVCVDCAIDNEEEELFLMNLENEIDGLDEDEHLKKLIEKYPVA